MSNADKKRAEGFLDELQESRKKSLLPIKEAIGLDILKNSHPDLAQFIYELIQNADDTHAKEVKFKLYEDRLEVRHNGTDFTRKDVRGITALGKSPKAEDPNTIGKFGRGFKEVYSVTDAPRIHSGDFNFEIRDVFVPVQINNQNDSNETLIILPFKENANGDASAKDIIRGKFDELSGQGEILFFLQSVSSITFIYDDDTRKQLTIKRKEVRKSAIRKHLNKIKATEVSCTDSNGDWPFLVIESNEVVSTKYPHTVQAVSATTPHTVQIAFQMDTESGRIIPCTWNNSVFVFLPTAEKCDLPFLVHAPYQITSNRASILKHKDSQYNRQITKLLATLVADSLPLIRDLNLLDNKFLNELLPLSKGNDDDAHNTIADKLHNTIASAVIDKLKVEALLPSAQGEYITADKAAVPLDDAIASFLDLPKGNQWLASKPELVGGKLINKLEIECFSLETLADNSDFINAKDWVWLDKFYKAINETFNSPRDIKDKFGDKPIVPLANDGEWVAPSDKIYLPTSGIASNTDFQFVEPEIAKRTNAEKFLEHFDIAEVDNPDRVEKIIEKYQLQQEEPEEYREHILAIEQLHRSASSDGQVKIKRLLNSAFIVPCEDGLLHQPDGAYLPTDDILAWFENIENKPKIVKRIGSSDEEKGKLEDLFSSIGCRKEIQLKHPDRHLIDRRGWHEVGKDSFNPAFDIDGLNAALNPINFTRSKILWFILLNKYGHDRNYNRLRGEVRESSDERYLHVVPPKILDSKAVEELDTHNWIYDKREQLIPTDEIKTMSPDDLRKRLHPDYTNPEKCSDTVADLDHVDALLKVIINDEEVNLEKHKKVLEENRELKRKVEQYERAERARSQSSSGGTRTYPYVNDGHDDSSDDWQPECDPEDVVFDIRDAESPAPLTRAPSEKSERNEQTEDETEAADEKAPLIAAKVGRWGEEVVFLKLKEEHPDSTVTWENERDEAGNSYDISIKRDDATKTYVEVKSTKKSPPAVFRINASQWHAAKECESGSPDKYVFYFVFEAGSKYPEVVKLESPEAQFKAGALICHPLGLRISVGDDELDSPGGDAEDAV